MIILTVIGVAVLIVLIISIIALVRTVSITKQMTDISRSSKDQTAQTVKATEAFRNAFTNKQFNLTISLYSSTDTTPVISQTTPAAFSISGSTVTFTYGSYNIRYDNIASSVMTGETGENIIPPGWRPINNLVFVVPCFAGRENNTIAAGIQIKSDGTMQIGYLGNPIAQFVSGFALWPSSISWSI